MNISKVAQAGNVAKVAEKAGEAAKVAEKAADIAKVAEKASGVAKAAGGDLVKITEKASEAAKVRKAVDVASEVAVDTLEDTGKKASRKTIERISQKGMSSVPVVAESQVGGLVGAFKHWVSPNPPQDLLHAVEYGSGDSVSKLLSEKLDVNFVNELGETPLAKAAKRGDSSMVKSLLDAGADPNLGKVKPLSYAAKNTDVANMLKSAGALQADTDLFGALKSGKWGDAQSMLNDVVQQGKLIDTGLNPTVRKEAVETALKSGNGGVLKSLFETDLVPDGVNLNITDKNGMTALHRMAFDGVSDPLSALADSGASLGALDPKGRTPLYWAAARGKTDTVKALLDAGANPNIPDKLGYSILDVAQDRGQSEIAGMLKNAGAESVATATSKTMKFNDKAVSLFTDELELLRQKPNYLPDLMNQRYLPIYGSQESMKQADWLIEQWRTSGQKELRSALNNVLEGKDSSNTAERVMGDMMATRRERWNKLSQVTGIQSPESFELYRGVGGKEFVKDVVEAWKDDTIDSVIVPHNTLMSWSTDRSLSEKFAQHSGTDASVILKKDVPFDMTVADMYVDAGTFLDESSITGNTLQHEVVVATKEPNSLTIPKKDITVNYQGKTYTYDQRADLIAAWGK